jgi:aminocarboxymuconate-semialdehyde decarboxylase
VRTVGEDRVVLGSDHPFWMGDPEPLAVVCDAGLTVEAQAAIRGANATRLFHLDAAR